MAEMFDLLETISPWWWVAFALGLGAIEMATMSFYLIWPALAAVLMAVLTALLPSMPGEIRIGVFAALSILLTFAGRSLITRFGDGGAQDSGLNRRGAQMVGRRGTAVRFEHGEGTVEIDGIPWRAKAEPPDAIILEGAQVRVVGTEGMVLQVSRNG